jgi:hypothetical protein
LALRGILAFASTANSIRVFGGKEPGCQEKGIAIPMKRKLPSILLGVTLSIAALGYFLEWYTVSVDNAGHQVEIHITIYKDKIKADEEKAKVKLQKYEKQFKEDRGRKDEG